MTARGRRTSDPNYRCSFFRDADDWPIAGVAVRDTVGIWILPECWSAISPNWPFICASASNQNHSMKRSPDMNEQKKMNPGTDQGGEGGTSGNWGGGATQGTGQKGVPVLKKDKNEKASQIPTPEEKREKMEAEKKNKGKAA
jgi:hypothetical protein